MAVDSRSERLGATMDVRPDRLGDDARQRLHELIAVLARVRRRLWLQRSAARSVRLLTLAGLLFASLIILIRSAAVAAALDSRVELGGICVGVLGVLWMVLHQTRWRTAAHVLDGRAQGYDRAATALDLTVRPMDPAWTSIQADAATTWARGVDLPAALPWRRPQGLAELAVAALCVVTAFVLPLTWLAPAGRGGVAHAVAPFVPPAPLAFPSAADLLSADALTLLREDAEVLADIGKQVDDVATKRWLERVAQVLRDVEQGRVDKRTALVALAKLERTRPGASGNDSLVKDKPSSDPTGKDADPKDAANQRSASNDAANQDPAGKNSAGKNSAGKNSAGKNAAGTPAASDERRAEKDRQTDRAVTNRVANALNDALAGAPEGAMRDAMKKAAEKKDLGLMGRMLEKLAERAQKDMNDKELKKWMKVAEKFADKLGDQQVPKRFSELERRVRRLQAKRKQQGGLGQSDRRRLASNKRELQQLQKEHGDVAGAKYQLQRLQKEAKKAAQELRRTREAASRLQQQRGKKSQRELRRQQARSQMQRGLREQMRRAAGEMRRQSGQQRTRQAQRIGQRRLRDLKDTLRRSGEKNTARKDFERRAREKKTAQTGPKGRMPDRPTPGQQSRRAAERRAKEKAARQAQGQGKQRSRDSEAGRRGKKGQRFRLGQGDMPDRTRMRMMRQSQGQGDPTQPGSQQGEGSKPGGKGNQPGQGQGGPNTGKRNAMAAARTEQVKGVDGEGPSIKKVFTEAAKRGFARRGWRQVYADYSEVAEEMMESEGLPVGRKALVKRYFELIRPR